MTLDLECCVAVAEFRGWDLACSLAPLDARPVSGGPAARGRATSIEQSTLGPGALPSATVVPKWDVPAPAGDRPTRSGSRTATVQFADRKTTDANPIAVEYDDGAVLQVRIHRRQVDQEQR